jgi:hypothetical protein
MGNFFDDMDGQMGAALDGVSGHFRIDLMSFVATFSFITWIFNAILDQLGDFKIIIVLPLIIAIAMMFVGMSTRESTRIGRERAWETKITKDRAKRDWDRQVRHDRNRRSIGL